MDITKFINSKDIREHLINIGYKFNSLEAAWLIFQCKSASIEEKHQAFKELIGTMPDCKIEERMNTDPQDSLHAYLQEYMDCENKLLNDFFTPEEDWFYTLEWYEDNENIWNFQNKLYNTFESAQKEFLGECAEWHEKFRYNIKKQKPESEQYVEVCFDPGNRIMHVFGDFAEILHGVFKGLWFDFPTPFKKGDILCRYDETGNEHISRPFVMTDITPKHARKSTRKYGDNTDMIAWGYFQDAKGQIYSDVMYNYMDLGYYRGDFMGCRRILTAFSNYVKGELDVALLCEVYHYILCEEEAAQKMPFGYTKESLRLAGIKV